MTYAQSGPPPQGPGPQNPAPQSPASKNRLWIWIVSGCCVLLLIAAVVLGLVGFFVYRASQAEGGDPTVSQSQGGGESAGAAVEVPVAEGTVSVSFGAVTWDAAAEVAEASSSNEPAPEGQVYVIAPVSMTYSGSGELSPFFDTTIEFIGADGQTYTGADALVEDDFVLLESIGDGETTQGNLVFLVPEAAAGGGEFSITSYESDQPQTVPAA